MTLTVILTAHRRVRHPRAATDFAIKCLCGWESILTPDELDELTPTDDERLEDILSLRHAAHVVEEMAAANIVAIELPEADTLGCWEAGTDTVFRDGDEISAVVSSASEAQLVYPTDPAALAAALLAAAVRPTPTPGENP